MVYTQRPTDEALRYDIEMTKAFGFNMCRKHVKVEPARWYYWCDRLGLLVWQDMPNGDRHIRPGEPDIQRTDASEANYRREWQRIVKATDNHPSIVTWVPFNEGWGQFKTNEILDWTKQLDPTRLVDGPSGWQDRGGGDMHDMHKYPGPDMPQPEPRRAVVLGEFGGLGWPVEGHLWLKDGNWGYRTYHSAEELRNHYDQLVQQLRPSRWRRPGRGHLHTNNGCRRRSKWADDLRPQTSKDGCEVFGRIACQALRAATHSHRVDSDERTRAASLAVYDVKTRGRMGTA